MANNIYLIGMMGSGKSVISVLLAKQLNRNHIDLDEKIVQKEGMSITNIFEQKGENYFRELEQSVLDEILSKDSLVVATGGGIVASDQNLEKMKQNGIAIYLKASTDILYSHIKKDTSRPLLNGGNSREKLNDLFEHRKHQYEKADYTFSIDGKTPDEITENLIELLELEGKI